MSIHDVRFPGESATYREQRDLLLQAEMALREQAERVAQLRRTLPPGGEVQDYVFQQASGPITLSELFGQHDTLIVYSVMYSEDMVAPCPMCSAFIDSVSGHLHHIQQRSAFVAVVRSGVARMVSLCEARGWQGVPFASAADNTFAGDFHTEMPDGAQLPMCTVFSRSAGGLRHFWSSELFFAPSSGHPRHVDQLWPLWNFLDITPLGRGDFMPALQYAPS